MYADPITSRITLNTLTFREYVESLPEKQNQAQLRRRRQIKTLPHLTSHSGSQSPVDQFPSQRSVKVNMPSVQEDAVIEQGQPTPKISNHFRFTPLCRHQGTRNLIRNQQLFNEAFKRRQLPKSIHIPNVCVTQSNEEIVGKFMNDLVQSRSKVQNQCPLDQITSTAEEIFEEFLNDKVLKGQFSKLGRSMTHVFRYFLQPDSAIHINLARLRFIHQSLKVQKVHFTRFKHLFLQRFIKLGYSAAQISRGCEKIEALKPYVLNQKVESDYFPSGAELFAKAMYEEIYDDYTLSHFFDGIPLDRQSFKFGQILSRFLSKSMPATFTQQSVREAHAQFGLTTAHFTNFKLHFSHSLERHKVGYSTRRKLLKTLEIYKYDVMNRDSLKLLVEQYGFEKFLEAFIQKCMTDLALSLFIHQRGVNRFRVHSENMFNFFFKYDFQGITVEDLEQIHLGNRFISEKILRKIREFSIQTVEKVTRDKLIITDFVEDWDEIEPIILGQNRALKLKLCGGQQFLKGLTQKLWSEMLSRSIPNHIQYHEVVNFESVLLNKLNLLLYPTKYYRKQDLQVIHSRLKIDEKIFNDFVESFKAVFRKYPQFEYIVEQIYQYKPYIVTF